MMLLIATYWKGYAQSTVSGYVKDSSSREPLIGVTVRVYPDGSISQTNRFGYFSVSGASFDSLTVSYVGYGKQTYTPKNNAYRSPVVILLRATEITLDEVQVKGGDTRPTEEIGVIKILPNQVRQMPGLIGEKDLLKTVQTFPGVQRGAEGSTALYVRGGSADQNLILLDEAVVYNPNHFFGFFSVFNADAVSQINFYRGGIPASIGGRLSSVLDISQKEGDKSALKATGSIGFLSSKVSLEGPVKKNVSSFIVSARRTNLDPVLMLINSPGQSFKYRFYDFNVKFSVQVNPRNKIYVSGFTGDDKLGVSDQYTNSRSGLKASSQSKLRWGNTTGTVNWFSVIDNRYSLSSVFTYTNYNSILSDASTRTPSDGEPLNIYTSFGSGIQDYTLKSAITKNKDSRRTREAGILLSRRSFNPATFSAKNLSTSPDTVGAQPLGSREISLFVTEKFSISPKVSTSYGLRYTVLGVRDAIYHLLEPRFSFAFRLSDDAILKAAYDRNTQSVNLLQSSGFGLSTDLYVPSTASFRPSVANQVSVGYETRLSKGQINASVEAYVKRQSHILSFKEGVSLFLIGDDPKAFDWQKNVAAGQGLSYGLEVGVRKPYGKLTGWASYTWAKTTVLYDELNNGLPFHPFQDQRHNLSIVSSLKMTRRLQVSANWIFTTGFPVTLPVGYYRTGIDNNNLRPVNYYGGRNASRMPVYHRLDVSLTILPKRVKKWSGTWELGAFNAYNRKNAFNAYLQLDNSTSTRPGTNLSVKYGYLLPIIPSITYHFKFQ